MSLAPRIDNLENDVAVKEPARNLIINGAMDFWQRTGGVAESVTVSEFAGSDRFKFRAGGSSSSIDVSRSTDVPTNFASQYSVDIIETGDASANTHDMAQRIEADDISPYIGQEMTFSFWFKSIAFANDITARIYTPTGGRDVWNSDIRLDITEEAAQSFTPTPGGGWVRYSLTFTVPSSASNGLQILLRNNNVDDLDNWRTTGWMLNLGGLTNFNRAGRNISDELAMCQRYYEKSYAPDTNPGSTVTGGRVEASIGTDISTSALQRVVVQFNTNKRNAPTISIFDTTGASGVITRTVASGAVAGGVTPSIGATAPGTQGFRLLHDGATNTRNGLIFHWTADAEL